MAQPTKSTPAAQPQPVKTSSAKQHPAPELFGKENITWMLIGLAVMAVGFFLMTGGKSDDPNTFNVDSVYSFTRITIAPILIIAGLIIEIFAIMRKPKNDEA